MLQRALATCLAVLLGWGTGSLRAQDIQQVEVFRDKLHQATDDTARALAMAMICFHMTEAAPDSARWYGEQALELAQRIGNANALGAAWNNLGWLDVTVGRFESGEARLEKALAISKQLDRPRQMAVVLGNLGSSANMRGDKAKALQYYTEGLRLNESVQDSMGMANSLYSVGISYLAMKEPAQGLEYLEKALALAKAIPWPDKEAVYLTAIANAMLQEGDTVAALERYKEAAAKNLAHGRMASAGYAEVNMGMALKRRNPALALEHLGKALAYFDSADAPDGKAYAFLVSGQVKADQGRFQEAWADLDSGRTLAWSTGVLDMALDLEKAQAELAGDMGNAAAAVDHFTRYIELKDSLQGADTQRELARLRTEFETERKEKDNELLRAENRLNEARIQRRNVQLFGLVAFALMALVAAALYRRNFREKKRSARMLEALNRQLADSNSEITEINALLESRLLRSQMNPHFIFNALGSAMQLASEGRSGEAVEYLQGLAKLMRMVLDHSVDDAIGIGEEVEFLKQYLRIEAYRMADLTYTVEADEALLDDDAEIPALVVQPFVENALGHGLYDKHGERKLEVRFTAGDGEVLCTITDNGVGRSAAATAPKSGHRSLGMQLTQDRIRLLSRQLGRKSRVEVEDLQGPDGQPAGTRVALRLALAR